MTFGDFETHPVGTAKRLSDMLLVAVHAAEILEQEAEALKDSHTVNGEWRDGQDEIDAAAHAEHDDLLFIARRLRELCEPTPKAVGRG
jgi:hypothetical protein